MMAEFGFKKIPFDKSIKDSDLMNTQDMREALARFEYLKISRGIMMITGDSGTGKTCILRKIVSSLNPQNYHHCYSPHSTISRTELYRQISILFNLPPKFHKTALYQQIQQTILDLSRNKGKIPCIILDECHLMDDNTLEELVLLTNFEMDSKLPMLLILSGSKILREKLERRRHEALHQRITFRYHVQGLNLEEAKKFIDHHLKVAGRNDRLFDDKAIELIHSITAGVPRKISNLCYQSLILGAVEGVTRIDTELVHKASGGL